MSVIWKRLPSRVDRVLLLTVIIPTLLSALYFGVIATDIYTSESRFVVRSAEKSQVTGLGVLLNSAGFSNSSDETAAVEEFIASRDALAELDRKGAVRAAYSRDNVSIFERFDGIFGGNSQEELFKFYRSKVDVVRDGNSGVSVLTVRAYTPQDAQSLNRSLLEHSERLVNRLSERGRNDLISYAQTEVEEAKAQSLRAAVALSAFRDRAGVVDPEKQATVQLQMVSKLQDELIATRTQLLQLRSFTPQNPQIPVLQTRAQVLAREIDQELRKVAGGSGSLAGAAVQFQQLQLEAQFADKQLTAALASLQDARNEARRKQAYVERIAQPNLPDYPLEPRRGRGVLATLILGLIAYGIARMLMAGVQEHQL
jgi:capsular polysaccharide transport system permease protein